MIKFCFKNVVKFKLHNNILHFNTIFLLKRCLFPQPDGSLVRPGLGRDILLVKTLSGKVIARSPVASLGVFGAIQKI